MIRLVAIILLAALSSGCGASAGEARVRVEQAWARPAPAGDNGAVYLTIVNAGRQADALLSAQSDVARAVEVHETAMEGDVMKMHGVHRLAIPAGGSAQLKPGALHIMLVGLTRDLKVGDRFALTLKFEQSGAATVEVEVRQP